MLQRKYSDSKYISDIGNTFCQYDLDTVFSCPRHLLCWLFEHMWLWELEELPHTVLEIVQYFQKQYKNSTPVQSYMVISHTTLCGGNTRTDFMHKLVKHITDMRQSLLKGKGKCILMHIISL